MQVNNNNLFYEWNRDSDVEYPDYIEIFDETLRDGLQGCGLNQPTLEEKLKILGLMAELDIDYLCAGFPAVSPTMKADVEGIIKYISQNKLPIKIACIARSMEGDIVPIVELSQKFGIPVTANIFVGSSPIRQFVEGWNIKHILKLVKNSIGFAHQHHLPIGFATEDTSRSKPEDIKQVYRTAIEYGARRICITDTVGYANTDGTKNLVCFFKEMIKESGEKILLEWHGHNDRGLALSNALAALEAGVTCIHATGLGLGERTGNTSMEQLLVNLKLMRLKDIKLFKLKDYSMAVSRALGYEIPVNSPIVGAKAFSTGTGIHAAAIIKALKMGDNWLADRVYSSVPAQELGLEQKIEISQMSGKANVQYFLARHNIFNDEMAEEIFNQAKKSDRALTEEEMSTIAQKYGYQLNRIN